MKITILQENLIRALTRTQHVAGGKVQLPILSHVLLSAKENIFHIVATNLETTIRISAGVKVEEEGDICVPARLLTEFVNTLPKGNVSLKTEKEILTIVGGRSRATIPGAVSTEFPPVPEIQEHTGEDIDKEKLAKALSDVLFSAATDESRPLLTGIKIEKTEDGTVLAATDGYRLSVKTLLGIFFSDSSLVIPARALHEVLKMSQEEKEEKSVRLTETIDGQLQFLVGETSISTRKIEGDYPNYRKIIPASFSTQAVIDTEEAAKAVKSAAIFARDSAGIIKIAISPEGISVSANTPQVGENTVEADADVSGNGGEVAMNSRFLLDFLNNYSGENLQLEMTGALNPVVFRNPEDNTCLHIIMPVRIQA